MKTYQISNLINCFLKYNCMLLCFIKTLSNTVKGSHEVAVIAAIITRNNNMHMSALHHIIAQVLDHSGATDEVKIIK